MLKRLLYLALAPLLVGVARADTLDDALSSAYANNPNIEDARLAVRSAREDSVQAFSTYLPNVGVSTTYGLRNVETETQGIFGPSIIQRQLEPLTGTVQLQQRLYTGGRRDGQVDLARAGVEGARHGLRSTEQDVLLAVIDAYLSVRRDEEIVRLRQEYVGALQQQLAGTRRRLEVGEVSRTDVAQVDTRLAGARALLARAEAELQSSRARYQLTVGKPPEALAPVETPAGPETLDDAIRFAEERHPNILRSISQRRAARAQVEIERSALRPQLALVGRYDYNQESSVEGDRSEGASALAQLSVPLFEGGYSNSRVRQGQINVQRAEARLEGQRRQIVADVVTAWNNLMSGRNIVSAAQDQVAAAAQAVEGAERERGLGLRSTLDVLDAEQERRNAEIGLVNAQADETFAGFVLLAATGALTVTVLGEKD